MTLRWRIHTALEHFWEFRVRVPFWQLRRRYRRWRMTPEEKAAQKAYFESPEYKKTQAAMQELCKALEAGSYDAAPTELKNGCALQIEDLAPVMQCITYVGPRPLPKWWQIWKTWNKRFMRELYIQRERTSLKLHRDKYK
jgi:hypothetical protein